MDTTSRLALPLIDSGQAQKEITHNEALAILDLAVQPVVRAVGLDAPPAAPAPGDAWIVGNAPTDAWAGKAGTIAGWTPGGWRFLAPHEGMTAWSLADALVVRYAGGGWTIGTVAAHALLVDGVQVVGARAPAIADPAGGTTADAEARAALAAILAALRGHGLIAT